MSAKPDANTRALLEWCACPRCLRRIRRANSIERDRKRAALKKRRKERR